MAEPPASAARPQLFRWMWRDYLRPQLPWVALATVLMATEGAIYGVLSWYVQPVFDQIFVAGERGRILPIALAVSGIFVLRGVAAMAHRVMMARVSIRIAVALQSDLLRHLLKLDSSFFQSHSPGNLIERVRGDTQAASALPTIVFVAAGRDGVGLISLLFVAASIDWVWTLVAVAGTPLLVLPIIGLQRLVRRVTARAREAAAQVSTRLDESFHGIDTIKLNATEPRDAARFEDALEDYAAAEMKSQVAMAAIPATIDLSAALGMFLVLSYGGFQIVEGSKSLGEFLSFFAAMALIFEPLRRLGGVAGAYQAAMASLERVHRVFAEAPTILSPPNPKPLPAAPEAADITFRDVHFSYGDGPVLRGVSFTAEAGKTTALVGASGAGKTTVFRLLARLADADSGEIAIGGVRVDELALGDLRGLFSVVSQEALLFDETIRDNILQGREVPDEELDEVLHAAHVADFVARLGAGLETPAGPRGSALSGGQRQRVAIARALLRDTPILLLDEATSALDAQSEAKVQEAVERLSRGRTTLVIAHRLATIRSADRIIVMDAGKVVDVGTHDELIARSGIYAELHRLQFQP